MYAPSRAALHGHPPHDQVQITMIAFFMIIAGTDRPTSLTINQESLQFVLDHRAQFPAYICSQLQVPRCPRSRSQAPLQTAQDQPSLDWPIIFFAGYQPDIVLANADNQAHLSFEFDSVSSRSKSLIVIIILRWLHSYVVLYIYMHLHIWAHLHPCSWKCSDIYACACLNMLVCISVSIHVPMNIRIASPSESQHTQGLKS